MTERKVRRHEPEFRIEIAQQMLAGADVMALSRQHRLARSMMYRWRDALLKHGAAGLSLTVGRPAVGLARLPSSKSGEAEGGREAQLLGQIGELEREVGRQAIEIDSFKAVFKRLDARPEARPDGGGKSTPRSGA